MFKLYSLLFFEFLKIGVFAVGGGYAALPFLFFLQSKYGWFTLDELTDMIAVSNITPGPVGINMATYSGYKTGGITGSVIATTAIILIPFIISVIIANLFEKFKTSKLVSEIFTGLRPASCALLASIAVKLLLKTAADGTTDNWYRVNFESVFLFVIILIPFLFIKKNPLLAIIAGVLGGIAIKSF